MSGRISDRPEFQNCMDYLRKDDTLVVFKLDSLGRTTKQLIDLVEILSERGIQFQSINDHIDTSTAREILLYCYGRVRTDGS